MPGVVQYQQPNGMVTDTPTQNVLNIQFAGDEFLPAETTGPATSTIDAVVVVDSVDTGTGFVTIKDSSLIIDSTGTCTTPAIFNHYIEASTSLARQSYTINPGNTSCVVDLKLGTSVLINYDNDFTISFANIPTNRITVVLMTLAKANNNTPRNITFSPAPTTLMEGRQKFYPTATANARDNLVIYIVHLTGNVYLAIRSPQVNATLSTGTVAVVNNDTTRVFQVVTPKTAASNTIVTSTATGNLMSTDVVWDEATSTFTSDTILYSSKLIFYYFDYVIKTASVNAPGGVLTLDMNQSIFCVLTHDANLSDIQFTNIPTSTPAAYVIVRMKDAGVTVRDITWGSQFTYDVLPNLTQLDSAIDILYFTFTPLNTQIAVNCYQDFGIGA